MRTMSLSEAKNHLSEVVDSVDRTHERVTLTKNGRNAVVMLSVDDWESVLETMAVLSDPQLLADLDEAQREVDAGIPGVSVEEVRAALQARTDAQHRDDRPGRLGLQG